MVLPLGRQRPEGGDPAGSPPGSRDSPEPEPAAAGDSPAPSDGDGGAGSPGGSLAGSFQAPAEEEPQPAALSAGQPARSGGPGDERPNSSGASRGCRGRCCRRGEASVRTVWASSEELARITRNFAAGQGELRLQRDLLVNGRFFHSGDLLVRAGRLRRGGRGSLAAGAWEKEVLELMESCEGRGRGLRVAFSGRGVKQPWRTVLDRPCLVLWGVVLSLLALIVVGTGGGNLGVDTSFDSFMNSDSEASLLWNSFGEALAIKSPEGGRRLRACAGGGCGGRRLTRGVMYEVLSFHVTYASEGGLNLLTPSALDKIHSIENQIRDLPAYRELCSDVNPKMEHMCSHGVSFANLVYPAEGSESQGQQQLHLDGSGSRAVTPALALDWSELFGASAYVLPKDVTGQLDAANMSSGPCTDRVVGCHGLKDAGHCGGAHELYMRDFCARACGFCTDAPSASGEAKSVTSMRSLFSFETRVGAANDATELKRGRVRIDELFARFLEEMSSLVSRNSRVEIDPNHSLRVYWFCSELVTHDAMAALQNDLKWAGCAFLFVVVYATVHTASILYALLGLLLVMLAIPAAAAIFCLASGLPSLSLLMCLSVFIIIGVGSDMIFVYTDFWRYSSEYSLDPEARLKYVYSQAASSTAATSFTTTASFLANLASSLRALREFGFFMGVCVAMAWAVVLFGYPPILIIGDRCHRRLRRKALQRTTFIAQYDKDTEPSLLDRLSIMSVDMLSENKTGFSQVWSQSADGAASWVRRLRFLIVLVFLGWTALTLGLSASRFEQDSEPPQLFDGEHNLVRSQEYDGNFEGYNREVFRDGAHPLRDMTRTRCLDLASQCDTYECTTVGWRQGNVTSCSCLPHGSWVQEGVCPNAMLQLLVVGPAGPLPEVGLGDALALAARWYPNATVTWAGGSTTVRRLDAMHWETGEGSTGNVLVLPRLNVRGIPTATLTGEEWSAACSMTEVCYCGVERCLGSQPQPPTGLRAPAGLEVGGADEGPGRGARSLSQAAAFKVPATQRADLVLVLGMLANGSNRLLGESPKQPFGFLPEFQLEDPWAQRQALELCQTFPAELMVTDLTCWLIGFSEWVVANGGTWPVKAGSGFDQLAVRYVLSSKTAGRETKSYVWLDDGATRIQAFFSTVFVDLALSAGAGEALELKAKWDDHLAAFNEDARASVAGAWQTARIWVRAEAERVIVTSTVLTLGIALFLVFVGVLVFTRSFGLAIVVMSTVTMIIVGLFFFMVVVMGWLIGAVEVLSLIMFIGFAVDYCLHIAHKYHACIIHDVTEEADDSHENAEQKTMLEKAGAAAASRLRQSVALTGNTRLGMAASVAGAKILRKQAEGSDGSSTGTPPGRTASPQRTRVTMRVADTLSSSKLPSPPSPTCDAVRQANRGAERFERAKFALEKIGPSVLGSGLTTLGSAAFLLPCSLHVFYRIGAVVCGITVYAEFFALLFLPATLMIIGPAGHNFRGCMLFNLQDWDVDPLSSNIDSHARNKGIYVLNVPVRGMAQMTPGQPASRTRIIASG